MTKWVKYIGDPNDDFSGPSKLKVKGNTYTKGEQVDVPEKRWKKLRGNNHFEVEGGYLPDASTVPDQDEIDEEEVETVPQHSIAECRTILDDRRIRYRKTDDLAALISIVEANGGFPETEAQD